MKGIIAAAGMSSFLFFSVAADAAEFKCGKDYVTFQTTGKAKSGAVQTLTIQKRLVSMVVMTSDGEMAVGIGRDSVPGTSIQYITSDTYRRLIGCLD